MSIMQYVFRVWEKLLTPINLISLKLSKVDYGRNLRVKGLLFISNNGSCTLGNNVRINSAGWANPIGGSSRTYIQVFKSGKMVIGDNTGISNCAITCASEIVIGKNVLIGAGARIYDTDFHCLKLNDRIQGNGSINTRAIYIGDGAFIGSNALILKGVKIGQGAVIGADSVITKDVPDFQIWAGNPAKYIRRNE